MSTIALLPGEGKQVKLGPMGIEVVFKLYSEDTGGGFALVEHPMAPGTFAVPHVHHNEDEYTYVLEGEVGFQLGDKVTYVRPGGLIAKPRDIWHAFWNESASRARVLEIITPGGMERYFEDIAELFVQGRIQDSGAQEALAKKYNIISDPSRIPALVKEHHLLFEGMPDLK